MIEAALQRFDKRSHQMHREFGERTQQMHTDLVERNHQMHSEMKGIENSFLKALNRNFYLTVSILGGLIVAAGAFSSLFHSFSHAILGQ